VGSRDVRSWHFSDIGIVANVRFAGPKSVIPLESVFDPEADIDGSAADVDL